MTDSQPIRLNHEQVFINLPVRELDAPVEFYRSLGFTQNLMFTDENATSFEISDHVVVMLLKEDFFNTFHDRGNVGSDGPREVLNALSAASPEDVDELLGRVERAGGTVTRKAENQGPMYGGAFDDLDGHGWEIMYMDLAAFEAGEQA